jgi:hypothetical protein
MEWVDGKIRRVTVYLDAGEGRWVAKRLAQSRE